MRKVQQQQPLASTSNNNYQFSQQFVQQYPNYYRAQPSQFISNSFYTQPTNNNSGPVYNMPASQQYYSNPSMISYGNPTSRFSPSKIQKPKKTSPIMNRYLSPKLLANSGVMKNVYQPSSHQTSIPTVIYANNNAVQYSNSQPQQQTHVKQTYRGGVKSSTSIPSINTVQQNRNYSNPQPMTATHSNQPQTQIYQHRYPTNSNQNMTTAQQQPMHINQHKNYAATTKPLMRQQQTVTRNPQTSNSSMYSNTNNTTSNNDQVHKHYHHHYPSNTSERTIMHHVLNSNNTSVNSSISSVGSAYSNVSRLSANTSILSNMSDVSEHDYLSEQRQMPQTSGSILDPRTRSWNSFTPSSAANQPTNTTEKKSEVVERKPAKALEPTMVEHDDQDSTYKTLSQNRSAAWMWSPTKIQRAQERTKRQIMSVLLSPSSSEDDEDEEIFAKIQQRYNEATIRINSIINSTAPPTTNNKLDACMQTDESIFQNTRSAPKKAPQLSDSHDSDSVRSRPTAFKSQTLTTSFQQQKDKIDSFYLPPIVFPSSLSEDMDFNIDSIRKSSQKQESNHSLSSSSSSEGVMFSPINNTSTKVAQPISIASGNNRYIVDSMINSVLEEDLKEDEDMVLYDDFDSEESTSSIGFGDCSLSSFGSPCSVGKIDLSTSLEGVLSNSDEMRRMVEKEIFLSKNKPKDRIKFSEDSVEITSFRQSRQISTVSLVSHCINQIFLNGSPETTLFLERMITIVCDRADIDFRCALSALFFMVKLQNPTFITDENNYNLINEFQRKSAFGNIEPSNFIYTFFVTLMISSKINEDNYYNNKTFFKYMAVNEFKQIFHAFNLDNAFNYMNDMELLMVKEDGSVPVQQTLSCSERVHSQTLANERYKKYFQQFNITEVNITMALKYDVCVKEESLCNFLDKLERVNESLLIC